MAKTQDWQIHLFSETEVFWTQCCPFKVETEHPSEGNTQPSLSSGAAAPASTAPRRRLTKQSPQKSGVSRVEAMCLSRVHRGGLGVASDKQRRHLFSPA